MIKKLNLELLIIIAIIIPSITQVGTASSKEIDTNYGIVIDGDNQLVQNALTGNGTVENPLIIGKIQGIRSIYSCSSDGVFIRNTQMYLIIQNVEFTSCAGHGYYFPDQTHFSSGLGLENVTHVLIRNNIFKYNGYKSILEIRNSKDISLINNSLDLKNEIRLKNDNNLTVIHNYISDSFDIIQSTKIIVEDNYQSTMNSGNTNIHDFTLIRIEQSNNVVIRKNDKITHMKLDFMQSQNCTAVNNTLIGGIGLTDSNYNIVQSNTISQTKYYLMTGIAIGQSNNNIIKYNTIKTIAIILKNYAEEVGILIVQSKDNFVSNNQLTCQIQIQNINSDTSIGISQSQSVNNYIKENEISNYGTGIYLVHTNNSILENNHLENNKIGINLLLSNYNTIKNNSFSKNSENYKEKSGKGNKADIGNTIPGETFIMTIIPLILVIYKRKKRSK